MTSDNRRSASQAMIMVGRQQAHGIGDPAFQQETRWITLRSRRGSPLSIHIRSSRCR
jgi:hypothetical protein